MSDEARSMWKRFITAPENAVLLKRYAKSAKEPAPLFDSIGEDLGSTNEEVRTSAFWALVAAMPELTNILHERETRAPGWRDRKGEDQQMVNQGVGILDYLHRKLVKGHRFKTGNGYGKDPRAYVNRTARNWKIDEQRQLRREVPLDYEAAIEIPYPAGSVEDVVQENTAYEECKREIRALRFLKGDGEVDLFETVYVDESSYDEVRKLFGIREKPILRKRISRARKSFVAVRDEVISYLLIMDWEFSERGKIPRSSSSLPMYSDWWRDRVKNSVHPRAWLNGVAADGKNMVAIRPITTGLRDASAHVYILAVHKGYQYDDLRDLYEQNEILRPDEFFQGDVHFDDPVSRYVDTLITLTSKGTQERYYIYCPLTAYPTELPGLNKALAEVRDDYNILLISNAIIGNYIPFYPYILDEAFIVEEGLDRIRVEENKRWLIAFRKISPAPRR